MTEPDAPVIHVVAHTHWDREWYHPAERFRQRLVRLVDELLDDPPAAGTSFLLDGQAVLLDDYLAVRPERAAELAALLRDGRLEAGPWYVLADELIPGGEALVRNLLAGRETVRRLRGEPPAVLYCPDSFGHPAVLPELARGFGCSLVVLWRGYGGARWPAGDTVRWRGPSGAEVVLHHLPPDGYEFGSSLPAEEDAARARWSRVADVLLPRSVGQTLLLNGADHHARQRDQPAAVALLARVAHGARVVSTSLASAGSAIARAAESATLPTVTGELRDSHGYTWTLGGTLGTRASQKRRNAIAERTLVRDVEPWIALAGDDACRALLHTAWRDLLHGHPHDTLCGTSIDPVADALDARLTTVQTQADGLREDALVALLAHDVERARHRQDAWRPALVLRNPAVRARSGVARVTLATKLADVAVGPGSAHRQGSVVVPPNDWPSTLGAQVLSRQQRVALAESPRSYPDADLVEEVAALVWADTLGGYAVRVRLGAGELPESVAPVRVAGTSMENGLLEVEVSAGGAVTLSDLRWGRVVRDLLVFERRRDVGDLYTPAIREPTHAPRFEGVDVVHRGPLRGEVLLRYDDAGARVAVRLQLDAGLAALRVVVAGENRTADSRLRLVVASDAGADADGAGANAHDPVDRAAHGAARGGPPTGKIAPAGASSDIGSAPAPSTSPASSASTSGRGGPPTGNLHRGGAERVTEPLHAASLHGVSPSHAGAGEGRFPRLLADAAFHPVARRPLTIPDADAAMEQVVPTAPLHRYVSLYGTHGMTLFADGLAEYEHLPPGRVAVTLLRAVGELSRHDLPERPGHAGWPAPTPKAQSLGPYDAAFAIALHGADSAEMRDAVERLADDVLLPITGEMLRANLGGERTAGGLELDGAGLAFSAAMPARRAGWIVLRCVNRRDEPVRGAWRVGRMVREAHRARLDETPGDALPVSDHTISFTAAPMEIVTVLARIE